MRHPLVQKIIKAYDARDAAERRGKTSDKAPSAQKRAAAAASNEPDAEPPKT